jgi:hypothetical protein
VAKKIYAPKRHTSALVVRDRRATNVVHKNNRDRDIKAVKVRSNRNVKAVKVSGNRNVKPEKARGNRRR